MSRYDDQTVTFSEKVTADDGTATWTVYLGSDVVGTVTKHSPDTYTATVNGYPIGDTYPRLTVAAAAVKVTAIRSAAL